MSGVIIERIKVTLLGSKRNRISLDMFLQHGVLIKCSVNDGYYRMPREQLDTLFFCENETERSIKLNIW